MQQPQVLRSALDSWSEAPLIARRPGVKSATLADYAETIALREYVETIEQIALRQGSHSLGWRMAQTVWLPHLGDIWHAIGASRTLGGALQRMCDYFCLLQDQSELRLVRDGHYAALCYRILDPGIWPRHQDAIFTLGLKARILFSADGFRHEHADIFLETREPALAADLSRVSDITCYAGAETNMIRFPAALLELNMPPRAPTNGQQIGGLHDLLREKRRSRSTEERVRTAIYQRLGHRSIAQSAIAAELGLSERTLRRQLATCNISFQQIVDDCRVRQAVLEIMRHRDMSIAEVALRVGYSEQSTFSRAFSRCTGRPPQSYLRPRPTTEESA
jgi:AraC-like DNA-binding protein